MPTKQWRIKNPERQKELAKRERARRWERIKNDPVLMEKAKARSRAWYSVPANKAKAITRHKQAWVNNPEVRRRKRTQSYKALYGITLEQKEVLLRSQDGVCAICGEIRHDEINAWHVDHDHLTGRVRGILCMLCNLLLGKAKDSPATLRAAAEYLERKR